MPFNITPATALAWAGAYGWRLLSALLVFYIGRWIVQWVTTLVTALLEASKVDETLVKFLNGILYYALLIVVVTAAAAQLGVNTASFLTILGTAGLAVGLALKDSLSNFAAGVMLVLFRPFKVNDYVTVGGVSGWVKEISIFHTLLSTPDNQQIVVPNGKVMGDVIVNQTKHPRRRIDLVVGISYGDDIKTAKQIMEKVLKEDERVLADPAPQVAVCELGDSSVNFVVRPWVETANYWPARFALIEKVKIALDEAGVTIPFPQRDVHLFQEKAAEV